LRADPLDGVSPKAVIVQFPKGDKTVPNPTESALIRAGGLDDRATYFRHDLALAAVPGYPPPHPPHSPPPLPTPPAQSPLPAQSAIAPQQQIATFFTPNGATTIDPDGPAPYFETPIAGPLPKTLNFAP